MHHDTALGTICVAVDSVQHARGPKLGSVEPGSLESYYMLAAFCFDAARKMEYIYKATREFAEEADSKLAREIRDDNDTVKKAAGEKGDWKRAAEALETIIRRLYSEIGEEHDRFLRQAAEKRS